MATRFRSHTHICSFCKRQEAEVHRLIAGPDGVFICDECVTLCRDILAEDSPDEGITSEFNGRPTSFSPREIARQLDQWVIGQTQAKKVLAVAVYNHYKRISQSQLPENRQGVELYKSNVLLLGPTGSGKTLLAQTLARILDVPFCIADATSLTEAGYVGEDVENIILRLVQAADGDIERAQQGILYIDEIDKAARKSGINPSLTRDVSGEGVQQALLKIIEGAVVNIPQNGGRKHPQQDFAQVDTSNILFIGAGVFDGLAPIIERRTGKQSRIGFQTSRPTANPVRKSYSSDEEAKLVEQGEAIAQVTPDDLIQYGLIPEFIGRLPIIVPIEPLTHTALIKILTEPRNAIVKQFKQLFAMDNVELEFTDDALATAANLALARQTGARGLRTIIEESLLDLMFEIPSRSDVHKCVITADVIDGTGQPLLYDRYNHDVDVRLSRAA